MSFDGKSPAIVYRSFETAGDSQTSLSELRVSSADGFLENFQIRCYVSGVLVSPLSFLGGQGYYNCNDVEMDDATSGRSRDNGAGIDSECVVVMTSLDEVLKFRDQILASKVCPGARLPSSFGISSAASAIDRAIPNTLAITTAMPGHTGRAQNVEERASGYITSCNKALYSLNCEYFSAPSSSSSSSSGPSSSSSSSSSSSDSV